MSKKVINIIIFAVLALLVGMFAFDVLLSDKEIQKNTKTDTPEEEVSQIHSSKYQETKQFDLPTDSPSGLFFYNRKLYLSGDSSVYAVKPNGTLLEQFTFPDNPKNLVIRNDTFFVLFKNYFAAYSHGNEKIFESKPENERTHFTAIDLKNSSVFIADAGNRRVLSYNFLGEQTVEFEGISSNESLHGFIIPSPYFHLKVNSQNELWVVNPGMHLVQHYSDRGGHLKSWGESGMVEEGFSGCCNPAYFTYLPNGNIITSEKGYVRVKVYSPEGEYLYTLAGNEFFKNSNIAPQPVTDAQGNIWLLDFDKKVLRFFETTKQ